MVQLSNTTILLKNGTTGNKSIFALVGVAIVPTAKQ
jgi:hypothetical protein